MTAYIYKLHVAIYVISAGKYSALSIACGDASRYVATSCTVGAVATLSSRDVTQFGV